MTIKIQFINEQKTLAADEIAKVMKPLEDFVNNVFAQHWNIPNVNIIPGKDVPGYVSDDATAWQVVFLDDSDQPGAAGYHELSSSGLPLSKVFTGTDAKYGISWTVDLSHEVAEMLADPFTQYNAQDQKDRSFKILEVCDACEADQYAITYEGYQFSDFVTPSWFLDGLQGSEPEPKYDYQGVLHAPFEIAPGGYIGVFKDGQWQISQNNNQSGNITADRKLQPHFGSRRLKLRNTPRSQWRRSEPPKAEVIGSVSITNVPGAGNEVTAGVSFPIGD